jgi:hypothetical protein
MDCIPIAATGDNLLNSHDFSLLTSMAGPSWPTTTDNESLCFGIAMSSFWLTFG